MIIAETLGRLPGSDFLLWTCCSSTTYRCGTQGPVSDGAEQQERFSLVDAPAVGGAQSRVCAHVRVCDHLPVKVLNFTNDLTMPPGAGPAPLDTFVCLSPYLESVPRVMYVKVSQSFCF